MKYLALICLLCLPGLYSEKALAKAKCKPYLEKLQNIQALQRQGYSLKRGNSLRKREQAAREKWWQCEQGKIQPTSKKSKARKKKQEKKKRYVKTKRTRTGEIEKKLVPFSNQGQIVLKGRFTGEKQQAWLQYYVQPKKCLRPKTTQVFAFCMEDKLAQQAVFEQEYGSVN